MNTIEGNKLIAEFMGGIYEQHYSEEKRTGWYFEVQPTSYYKENVAHINLNYNSDWNWLMPVVEKIESLDFIVEISLVTCRITEIGELFDPLPTFYMEYSGLNKIDSVWNIVTQFIEWHNSEQSVKESDTTKAT